VELSDDDEENIDPRERELHMNEDDGGSDSYQDEGEYENDRMSDEDAPGEDYYDDDQDIHDPRFCSSGPVPFTAAQSYNNSTRSSNYLTGSPRYSRPTEDMLDFGARSVDGSRFERPSELMYGKIARPIYMRMGTATIAESDDLLLGTEELITRLYEEGVGPDADEDALKKALGTVPSEILTLWEDYNEATGAHVSEEYAAVLGPGPGASAFGKANFVANLLLRLRQPPMQTNHEPRHSLSASLRSFNLPLAPSEPEPLPQLILEWINEYHQPARDHLIVIQKHRPSPAAHPEFWSTVLNGLMLGKVIAVTNALKNAGWKYSSPDDEEFYNGLALKNIEIVINDAIDVLQICPAIKGNWDIRSSDWTLYRLKVSQALENLKNFAEGVNRDRRQPDLNFDRSSLGRSMHSMSEIAKKAESQVPWGIYQRLTTLYDLLLGEQTAIISNASDWFEATVGLVVWWNPSRGERKLALGRSQMSARASDLEVYLDRLSEAFYIATSEKSDLQVQTLNEVEVALACVCEGDVESVLGLLRAWSGPVSSAVAEIAYLGGWLPAVEQSLISMGSLDQDDMDVLGISAPSNITQDVKDLTLIAYATSLADIEDLRTEATLSHPMIIREGWELAIEILGRLNSSERLDHEIDVLIKKFSFDSSETVDKLWKLLNGLGMTSHAENIAEVSFPKKIIESSNIFQNYANSLAEGSYKYGEALYYYALSHKSDKVKNVLDLLISYSLIHSVAYPPESELDPHLKKLISSPKAALSEMSKADFEAAQLLQKMISGYATLRRFYDLRDAEVNLSPGEKSKTRPFARRREATAALMAVITSSDDNIRGGLYDEASGAVVSVDFLLALLGEAMSFVNQTNSTITIPQINTLLKTIEDIQAVTPRVYTACEEFFEMVIASTPGLAGSNPMDMLKKSTSSLSGAGSFSMVGSSMLASQLQRSVTTSGLLSKGNIKRGWDWRRGLKAGVKGEDMLRILRFGLAQDLARAWIVEADGLGMDE
jgi:hypothetical protein